MQPIDYIICEFITFASEAFRFDACLISFSLTLERFLATCLPMTYKNLNRNKFISVFVIISMLWGGPPLFQLLQFTFKFNCNVHNTTIPFCYQVSLTGYNFYAKYIVLVIIATKILAICLMVIFSFCILHALRNRSRAVANMTNAQQAKKDFEQMKLFLRFQVVDTVVGVIFSMSKIRRQINFLLARLLFARMLVFLLKT